MTTQSPDEVPDANRPSLPALTRRPRTLLAALLGLFVVGGLYVGSYALLCWTGEFTVVQPRANFVGGPQSVSAMTVDERAWIAMNLTSWKDGLLPHEASRFERMVWTLYRPLIALHEACLNGA